MRMPLPEIVEANIIMSGFPKKTPQCSNNKPSRPNKRGEGPCPPLNSKIPNEERILGDVLPHENAPDFTRPSFSKCIAEPPGKVIGEMYPN